MENLPVRPWDAALPVFRCLIPVSLILAGIALFYVGFDRFEDVGDNLLPGDPRAFVLKDRNKPQDSLPRTTEGGVRFRLTPKQTIEISLDDPPAGGFVRLSGRMRTGDLLPGNKSWQQARFLLIPKDSDGKTIRQSPQVACSLGGDTDWTPCHRVFEVPDEARTLTMRFAHAGVTGTAELDAPTLTPVVVRGWHEFLRYALMVSWFGTALACVVKSALWRRPLGWLVVLLSIAILGGIATPKPVLNGLIQQGLQAATPLDASLLPQPGPSSPKTEKTSPTGATDPLRLDTHPGPMASQAEKAEIAAPTVNKRVPMGTAQKSGHAVLFAGLGAATLLVLVVGGRPASCPRTLIVAITAITIFAASTEVLQMLTTDRGPSFHDIGIDVAGACAGLTFTWIALRLLRYPRQT